MSENVNVGDVVYLKSDKMYEHPMTFGPSVMSGSDGWMKGLVRCYFASDFGVDSMVIHKDAVRVIANKDGGRK